MFQKYSMAVERVCVFNHVREATFGMMIFAIISDILLRMQQ